MRPKRILIVGNSAREQLQIVMMLEQFKYEVYTANAAAQALDQVAARHPSLVITEITLPGMSGFDLFSLLRQVRTTAAIPVLFLVPLSDAATERRCLDMGAAGCISKPVLVEDLYRTVQAAIEVAPRGDIRIDTRLKVYVNNEPIRCEGGETCTIDLSERGMYIPLERPYPCNQRITVQFQLQDRIVSAEGSVLHSRSRGSGSAEKSGMGLKFINLSNQDRNDIRNFIRETISRNVANAINHKRSDTR